ncbi:hypothetical protein EKO04_009284 [Ascochyta lentis]|uniref:Uncharacterized protein n=1 Tax=Ascochyta lentis TaxID=205686 RepID=A0A8H7ME40_9PLEO|nr:hypothetical protein EKO04_009284 [Ascochyta lentis]
MAQDPRKPTQLTVKVNTTLTSHQEGSSINQPRNPHNHNTTHDTDSDHTTPPPPSPPPRPLAHASSSGSLTTTPTKHNREISTTISPQDVKKWMEQGTFGDDIPERGVEQHVVCMSEQDMKAGQAGEKHRQSEREGEEGKEDGVN